MNFPSSYSSAFLVCLLLATLAGFSSVAADSSTWQSLFNGKDLTGWETFLGRANPSGQERKATNQSGRREREYREHRRNRVSERG